MATAVTVAEMLDAEADAMRKGWTEASLLESAGQNLGHAIARQFSTPGSAIAYLGKGHNAGDALVALKVLREHHHWNIGYRAALPLQDCAPLVQKHAARLGPDAELAACPQPDPPHPLLLLDGLLGTGSCGAPRPPLDELAAEMQWLRHHAAAIVAAIDLPSGVDADSGMCPEGAVTADITYMIGNAKAGLLSAAATNHAGALALVPLPPLARSGSSRLELIAPQTMDFGKSPRPFECHKGQAGRVSILAGSDDYPGAAALAATGALRGGAGMVVLHVPNPVLGAVRCLCPPEIIVRGYRDLTDAIDPGADARVVGCGLGRLEGCDADAFFRWLEDSELPTVIDADALNLIAHHRRHDLLRAWHVITPHPGEFGRLAPQCSGQAREAAAEAFCREYPPTLLLKGARSLIARSGSSIRCNSTGHPGMATAGQGDLLAGLLGARLAHGDDGRDAAALAAWLCGRAAERALKGNPAQSQESLSSSDVASQLGAAWWDWKTACR